MRMAGKSGAVRVQAILATDCLGIPWPQPRLLIRHVGGTEAEPMAKVIVPCTTASALAVILARLGRQDVAGLIESAIAQVAS
jgi:hypothetical protein